MLSSGTSGIGATAAGNVTLIPQTSPLTPFNRCVISNTGSNSGFFSVDGGNNWGYVPASDKVEWRGLSNSSVLIKQPGSNNLSGIYGFADWVPQK